MSKSLSLEEELELLKPRVPVREMSRSDFKKFMEATLKVFRDRREKEKQKGPKIEERKESERKKESKELARLLQEEGLEFDEEIYYETETAYLTAIPSLIDGLNSFQRKVLYTCFNKKHFDIHNMSIFHFVDDVAKCTDSEKFKRSLSRTVLKMAQDFVGSNNINLAASQTNRSFCDRGVDDSEFIVIGKVEGIHEPTRTFRIRDLPVSMPTSRYEDILQSLTEPEVEHAFVESFKVEHNSAEDVNIEITLKEGEIVSPDNLQEVMEKLNLTHVLKTNNITVSDANGDTKTYKSPEQSTSYIIPLILVLLTIICLLQ
ncbi:hypothetical protein RIF29_34944 [Crotalaria pallida]|uniref:DNA topoisomerase (ATP-hydrolyzing) n=1 Tax=Crotalaria pallida TaxID=3830 RepID=A0AAN9HTS6_CROPI